MQPPEGSGGESKWAKGRSPEPLPPLVSAALEPGEPTLAARLERLATGGSPRGRYTLLGEVAQGGMGRILRAWDEQLQREVAMKVVPRSPAPGSSEEERADHEQRLARFLDEARITAQLDHPGIVPVYEIGLDEAGSVFFTMPLVRGSDLKSIFALVHGGAEGWTLQRAVDVMHAVCLTVAFAHSKGVVHRDLKPENIMVGPFGEAYVLDWGLALLVGRAERASVVGTPAYMAPEQAAGTSAVGPHSDVYSLGAILYELFARRVPHATSLETRAGEPGSLQTVLATPPRPLRELRDDVPTELAAICAKAMAEDPRARYRSAREMADDLAAWLEGRVVSALDVGPWERLRKWRARNRALALTLDALVALALVGSGAFFLQQHILLREVQAKNAEVRASAYVSSLSAADLGLRAHETGEARRRLDACDPDLRGWEWRHLDLLADASAVVLTGHSGPVRTVAVSPDGRSVASGSDDGTVMLWDAETNRARATLAGHAGFVMEVAFSPDGRHLASASQDRSVRLWSAADGTLERVVATHPAHVMAIAFASDGALLASGDVAGNVILTDLADGSQCASRREERDGLVGLVFIPGTGELAAAYLSGTVRVLDPVTLATLRESKVALTALTALDVDARGTALAVAYERTAQVLDPTTLEELHSFTEHGRKVSCVAFAPDGTRLATTSFDNVLRVWDLAQGTALNAFDGHDDDVNSVAFFPDGERLVTGAEDDSLRLWDLSRAPVMELHEGTQWIDALAFAPDGARLVIGAHDHRLRVFDVRSGAELRTLATSGIVDCVAWSTRDELAFGCGEPGPDLADAGLTAVRALPGSAGPRAVQFDAAGKRLFARGSSGQILVYDVDGRRELATLAVPDDESATMALSSDGRWLAAGTGRGEVLAWNARTLSPVATWRPGTSGVCALAFSPDGARLAVGRENRSIALIATESGAVERTLDGHESIVSCLAFSPDGSRLVSGSYDHTLRLWDPRSDASLLTLPGHEESITAVAFDASGEVLASASKDGSVRLWRTARAFAQALVPPAPPELTRPQ